MEETNLFENKHLKSLYELQTFCCSKGYDIKIMSDYRHVSKLDLEPTEFLYLEYPKEMELVIEYWIYTNNVTFYNR